MESIWKNIKHNIKKPLLLSYLTIFFIGIAVFIMYKVDLEDSVLQYTTHVSDRADIQVLENFTDNYSLTQKISSPRNFDFITINFSDHDKVISGKTIINLYMGSKELDTIYIDNSQIHYGTPIIIPFKEYGGGKADIIYELKISQSGTKDIALGIYGHELSMDESPAFMNNSEISYALAIGMHSYTRVYFMLAVAVLIVSFISMFITAFVIYRYYLSEEKLFLVMAIPFAFCMLLFILPNGVYDGDRHLNTVYHYSNVLLGKADGDSVNTMNMRQGDIVFRQRKVAQGQPQEFWVDLQELKKPLEGNEYVQVAAGEKFDFSSIVEYFPAVLGMSIGRVFKLNMMLTIMLAKIFSLLSFMTLCYCAIKKTPLGKMVFVFVSLLPMNIYQATGITYDSTTYAVGIVVIAFIFKLWRDKLSKKEWIFFAIAVFVLGFCKGGVYLTVVLLLLIIPKNKFRCGKYKTLAIIILIGISPYFIHHIPVYIREYLSQSRTILVDMEGPGGGSNHYSILYIFKEPVGFLKLLVLTTINRAEFYIGGALGDRMAWSNKPITWVAMVPFLFLILISGYQMNNDKVEISIKAKVWIGILIIIEYVGFHIMVLPITNIYANEIWGVQGRYFMCFIPLIVLMLRYNGICFKDKREKSMYLAYSAVQFIYMYFFIKQFMCS